MAIDGGPQTGSTIQAGFERKPRARLSADLCRGHIEVAEFSPKRRTSALHPRALTSFFAAIASVLLHAALLTTAVWKSGRVDTPRGEPRPLSVQGPSALDEDTTAMEWVSVDDSAISDSNNSKSLPESLDVGLKRIKVAVDSPALAIEFDSNDPELSDVEAGTQLFGQYLAQINARIDRSWMRPRTPIGAGRFHCQVRIEQDPAGNVIEVLLQRCNGSSRWQLSLVHAIQSASPLPAPPDPALFAHAIYMNFQARPGESGLTSDQYEPLSAATAAGRSSQLVSQQTN
jgi:TonB C terminal